jgi:Glycosyltransferase family 87
VTNLGERDHGGPSLGPASASPRFRAGYSAAVTAAARYRLRLLLFAAAVVGTMAGAWTFVQHLATDPLADVRAYYDAGQRLNAGLALYPPMSNPDAAAFYRYPPLLALVFRPLALLPFDAAALLWELVMLVAFVLALRRIGMRTETLLALGILALPVAWTISVGQAQMLVTLLLAVAAPWSVALAAQLKLTPALAALFWLSRRDFRACAEFAACTLVLVLVQLALAPQATLDFLATLTTAQVGHVNNWSPYLLSPVLWLAMVIGGVLVAARLGRTRWGWAAAVALSVLATPRLLTYMFGSLLAALSDPARSPSTGPDRRAGPWPGEHR